jgi:hypothetical protein
MSNSMFKSSGSLNDQLRSLTMLLLLIPYFASAQERSTPKTIRDIPINRCSPAEALGWLEISSIEREGQNATQSLRQNAQLERLMSRLPKSNEPVSKLMNPEQAAEFAQISAQMSIYQMNHLAESHLQRDFEVMRQAADAIEKLRLGAPELKSKDDPEGNGAGLIGLLREAEKAESRDPKEPGDKSACNLDFSMYRQEEIVINNVQRLMRSTEAHDWSELRSKYKITGQLDPQTIPSPDREKAVWLIKAIAEPGGRSVQAVTDWENLRTFATISALEYSSFRSDIIAGAGAKDYDYDTQVKKAYAEADAATKRAIDAWNVINQQIPAEALKEAEERAKILHGAGNKTH